MNTSIDFLKQLITGFEKCGCLCKDIFSPDMKIGFGVSGGADSMALLYGAILLRKKFYGDTGAQFVVVSVNHNIRPREESLADCLFVRDFCEKFTNIDFFVEELEPGVVETEAKLRGRGIEEAARFLRYKIFQSVIEKNKCHYFCLAHNENDQLETVLLRFLQGSGDGSAHGIPFVRESFIRPLLEISRQNIESFLFLENVHFRCDATNQENEYLRNRCRNLLIPLLNKEFPGWSGAVTTGTTKRRWDNEFINSIVPKDFWQLQKEGNLTASFHQFLALHPALRRRILFAGLNQFGIDERVPFHLLEPLIIWEKGVPRGRFFSFRNVELFFQQETMMLRKIKEERYEIGFSLLVDEAGTYEIYEKKITILAEECESNVGEKKRLLLDGKSYLSPLILRNPLPGDKVLLSGQIHSVQDILKNNRQCGASLLVVVEEIENPFVSIIVLS